MVRYPPSTSILTNLQLRAPLHHLQNNVAADGMAHQDQAGSSGNLSPDESQLVLHLPTQTKHIGAVCCRRVCKKTDGQGRRHSGCSHAQEVSFTLHHVHGAGRGTMSGVTDGPHRVSGATHAVDGLHEGCVEAHHPWVTWAAQSRRSALTQQVTVMSLQSDTLCSSGQTPHSHPDMRSPGMMRKSSLEPGEQEPNFSSSVAAPQQYRNSVWAPCVGTLPSITSFLTKKEINQLRICPSSSPRVQYHQKQQE